MVVGLIGLGNMASAIIGGLRASTALKDTTIVGYDPVCEKGKELAKKYGIRRATSEREVLALCDTLILAVKPQILPTLLPTVSQDVKANCLVVSIAAGKPLSFYEEIFPVGTAVVRAMPNINAQVRSAVTAICAGRYVTETQLGVAKSIFETIGAVFELEENLFSAFTGISGSAVAFAYMYIDAVAKAGAKAGIDRETALAISAAATLGSAKMIEASSHTPEELVKMVCSPGGTTIEGVGSLQEDDFSGVLERAVNAVIQKDKKLAQGSRQE